MVEVGSNFSSMYYFFVGKDDEENMRLKLERVK